MFQKNLPVFGLDICSGQMNFFQRNKGPGLHGKGLSFPAEHFENLDHKLELAGNTIAKNQKQFPQKFRITPSLHFEDVRIRNIRIPKATHTKEVEEMITWELSETLEFSTKTHQLRYVYIGEMKERQGTRDEYLITVVANETVEKFITFFEQFKLMPGGLDFEGYAMARFLENYSKQNKIEQEVLGLLDIGYQSSSYIILRHGKLAFMKNFDFGFKHVDQQFTELLDIKNEHISYWRKNLEKEMPEETSEYLKSVLPNVLEPIEKMVTSCLRYYSGIFRGEFVQKSFLIGEFTNFPHLTNSISDTIGSPVEIPKDEAGRLHLPSWAKSIGQTFKTATKI